MIHPTHAGENPFSKRLILILILLLLVLPRTASSQSSEPRPRPEVKSWDFWIGDWKLIGTAKDTPAGPEYSVDWRAHGRWILEGAALEFTTTWKGTGPADQWVEIMSWDPARRANTFTGFSSTGEVWSGTADIGTGGFIEDFLVTIPDGRILKQHNEWTFGEDRLTVSGKSVCQLGNDQWTAFTVRGSKNSIGLTFSQDNYSTDLKGTFTDLRDGQIYPWIKIGNQIWMAENLRFHANLGCWANHEIHSDTAPYGRVYSWETARTACPEGWHLPNDAEWIKLVKYLGGSKIAGGKMKEMGVLHWQQPNTGATNESGFSAIPAVTSGSQAGLTFVGVSASFWSSSSVRYGIRSGGYTWRLFYDISGIKSGSYSGEGGMSIRCIRD